jgi:hypothetical protein
VDAKRFYDATVKVLTKTALHNMVDLALVDPSSGPIAPRIAAPGGMQLATGTAARPLGSGPGFAR